MIYYVQDFGAVGDGEHNDSSAIQAAIDTCHAKGGGRVVLSKGHIYRSGTIILRSNVDFHIEEDAVLKASDTISDFDAFSKNNSISSKVTVPTYENCEYAGSPTLFFLYAKNEHDLTISGKGCIDGNEEIFYGEVSPWHIDGSFYPRVPMMYLENINTLTITGLTLCKSAFWTVHPVGCVNVTISELYINNNRRLANCDGIDPDHCKNVRITNCRIISADDCIVFKNTESGMAYGPCENISVSNCHLSSTSAAIKFGTESEEVFRNINIENCTVSDSNRGISMQLRDTGSIENVRFSNISIETRLFSKKHWWGDGEPIAITAVKRKSDTKIGSIKNISFENITCDSESGMIIYGDDSVNIQNLCFTNLRLRIRSKTGELRPDKDLRPSEVSPLIPSRNSCLFARFSRDIRIRNFDIEVSKDMREYFEPYLDVDDCNDVKIDLNEA